MFLLFIPFLERGKTAGNKYLVNGGVKLVGLVGGVSATSWHVWRNGGKKFVLITLHIQYITHHRSASPPPLSPICRRQFLNLNYRSRRFYILSLHFFYLGFTNWSIRCSSLSLSLSIPVERVRVLYIWNIKNCYNICKMGLDFEESLVWERHLYL